MTGVTDIDDALQALTKRGEWHGRAEGDAELSRVEIRGWPALDGLFRRPQDDR
jgi:hypothetical protein